MNKAMRYLGLWLIASFAWQVPVHAQPAEDGDRVTVNMRDADVRSVIQWMADQTGKNFIVHSAVKGNVTVVSREPVTREQAYALFVAALQVNGLSVVETPAGVKIVPEAQGRQSAPPVTSAAGEAPGGLSTRVVTLTHVPAEQVAALLQPMVGQNGAIMASAQSNAVVVSDTTDNAIRLEDIIRRIDRGGALNLEAVPLTHGNAEDVAKSLTSLAGSAGNQSGNGGAGGFTGFAADKRTNSVLISGEPGRRAQLRQLVRQLDRPVAGDGNTQVYYLKYLDAKEGAEILKGIAQSIQKDQQGDSASTDDVRIEPSESTNALVVNAPPGLQNALRKVISQLDIRRTQVLVEALVVEVNQDAVNDIGVSWMTNNDYATDANGGPVTIVNGLGRLSLASSLSNLPQNSTAMGGLTFGFYKNGELRAALRALSSNTKTNVLSTPTIVALDNEEAELLVGQNVPFKTGEVTSSSSSTENPFTTIERKDIGVSLKVTPRINQSDSITLDILQTTESIAPSVDQASDIITNKTEIKTRALIRDGEVLVIGGLIKDDQREIKQKVPLLGDIPVLGRLFSSKGTNNTKSNLMVFIHPVILKDEAHVEEMTRSRYERMQQRQQDLKQEPPSWKQPAKPELPPFETFTPGGR